MPTAARDVDCISSSWTEPWRSATSLELCGGTEGGLASCSIFSAVAKPPVEWLPLSEAEFDAASARVGSSCIYYSTGTVDSSYTRLTTASALAVGCTTSRRPSAYSVDRALTSSSLGSSNCASSRSPLSPTSEGGLDSCLRVLSAAIARLVGATGSSFSGAFALACTGISRHSISDYTAASSSTKFSTASTLAVLCTIS